MFRYVELIMFYVLIVPKVVIEVHEGSNSSSS